MRGSNMPAFQAHQLNFADHIRNPEKYPVPGDIEARRMQIYVRLFYNNIEGFLANAFPVIKKIHAAHWPALVREFIEFHSSESPYFMEVPQEFLAYLDARPSDEARPFLLELAHYEWVEMFLATVDEESPAERFDPAGDLLGELVVSPLYWSLAYRYPVHRISPDYQPVEPAPESVYLIVYRQADFRVRFMESSALTHQLLEAVSEGVSGAQAVADIHAVLCTQGDAPALDWLREQAENTLARLRKAGIVLGTRMASASSPS